MPDSLVRSETPSPLARLRQAAANNPLVTTLGLLALTSLLFMLAPGLDLAVSAYFYEAASRSFSQWRFLQIVREAGLYAEWGLGIVVTLPLLLKVLFPRLRLPVPPRATLFVVLTFALSTGLIVNGILKEFWGRARPRQILEFGGDTTFSPAWWISDQCERNCSFVSGEASSAFCLLTLAFIVPREWRPAVTAVTLAFAVAVSFTRIAVGGHFLSDVLIAWLITLAVMIVLHRAILQGLPPGLDAAVETGAARPGVALRRLFGHSVAPPP